MNRHEEKVVVTGMGAVSCVGSGVDEFWRAVCDGRSNFQPINRFDVEGSRYSMGGMVEEDRYDDEKEGTLGAAFAADAARQAVSGLPEQRRSDLGVVLGSNFGPAERIEDMLASDDPDGRDLTRASFQHDVDHVAGQVGAGGLRKAVSLSCSSGNSALGVALELIRSGQATAVLAGGYDSIQRITWAGLGCLRVMAAPAEGSPPVIRPFDKERTGTVFSEGAGLLLLEAATEASARNADIQAELAGAGVNNNAYHMTHADSEGGGTAVAVRMALDDAGIHAGEVDHINSHGTGTELNDKIETRAFKKVFGERMDGISVTSIKGSVGHAMGAASALEAIASVKSIESGVIPPTANYRTPDPDCDVNVVSGKRRRLNPKVVVNNSAGIGGANAAVVFRRPQEE